MDREQAAAALVATVEAFIEVILAGRPDADRIRSGHDSGALHYRLDFCERRGLASLAAENGSGQLQYMGYVEVGRLGGRRKEGSENG